MWQYVFSACVSIVGYAVSVEKYHNAPFGQNRGPRRGLVGPTPHSLAAPPRGRVLLTYGALGPPRRLRGLYVEMRKGKYDDFSYFISRCFFGPADPPALLAGPGVCARSLDSSDLSGDPCVCRAGRPAGRGRFDWAYFFLRSRVALLLGTNERASRSLVTCVFRFMFRTKRRATSQGRHLIQLDLSASCLQLRTRESRHPHLREPCGLVPLDLIPFMTATLAARLYTLVR